MPKSSLLNFHQYWGEAFSRPHASHEAHFSHQGFGLLFISPGAQVRCQCHDPAPPEELHLSSWHMACNRGGTQWACWQWQACSKPCTTGDGMIHPEILNRETAVDLGSAIGREKQGKNIKLRSLPNCLLQISEMQELLYCGPSCRLDTPDLCPSCRLVADECQLFRLYLGNQIKQSRRSWHERSLPKTFFSFYAGVFAERNIYLCQCIVIKYLNSLLLLLALKQFVIANSLTSPMLVAQDQVEGLSCHHLGNQKINGINPIKLFIDRD